ncbi:MAG: DUF6291 domain-containing protein [Bacteroidota bacterium]
MSDIRFLFYVNWREQIELLDDSEVRRFINNLCNYAEAKEPELQTKADKLVWNGVLPALEVNMKKYNAKVESNRVNGRLGGAPVGNQNARRTETTQNNPNNPIIDNSKMITVNSEMEIDNSKLNNDNSELVIDNNELKSDNCQESIVDSKLENENRIIEVVSENNIKNEIELIDDFNTLRNLNGEYYGNSYSIERKIKSTSQRGQYILDQIKNENYENILDQFEPDIQQEIKILATEYYQNIDILLLIQKKLEPYYSNDDEDE